MPTKKNQRFPALTNSTKIIAAAAAFSPEHRSIIWAFKDCPRCGAGLYFVADRLTNKAFMLFCKECQYHSIDLSGFPTVLRLAQDRLHPDYHRPSPPRPLERAIRAHMKSLREKLQKNAKP